MASKRRPRWKDGKSVLSGEIMNRTIVYVVFIAAVLGLGLLIGTNNIPGEWYRSLAKPAFNPPDWIFAPV